MIVWQQQHHANGHRANNEWLGGDGIKSIKLWASYRSVCSETFLWNKIHWNWWKDPTAWAIILKPRHCRTCYLFATLVCVCEYIYIALSGSPSLSLHREQKEWTTNGQNERTKQTHVMEAIFLYFDRLFHFHQQSWIIMFISARVTHRRRRKKKTHEWQKHHIDARKQEEYSVPHASLP